MVVAKWWQAHRLASGILITMVPHLQLYLKNWWNKVIFFFNQDNIWQTITDPLFSSLLSLKPHRVGAGWGVDVCWQKWRGHSIVILVKPCWFQLAISRAWTFLCYFCILKVLSTEFAELVAKRITQNLPWRYPAVNRICRILTFFTHFLRECHGICRI